MEPPMTLHNHFIPPLSVTRPWEGFHSAWATMIAQDLNGLLPPEFVAMPQTSRGPMVEIDSARDLFEIRVIDQRNGPRLVGVIELISPANKDRPAASQAFVGKCAGYLRLGAGLIVVDVVTTRHHNLHSQLIELLELEAPQPSEVDPLYAVAYRTQHRKRPHAYRSGRRDSASAQGYPHCPCGCRRIWPFPLT